jgi:hypothetical protein
MRITASVYSKIAVSTYTGTYMASFSPEWAVLASSFKGCSVVLTRLQHVRFSCLGLYTPDLSSFPALSPTIIAWFTLLTHDPAHVTF